MGITLKMVNITTHVIVGFLIRVLLIGYGEIQDRVSLVQYTDVDYRVFTDAARHILDGNSPYDRHTYRYTPVIAAILTPNIFLHSTWGKFVFSFFDVVAGYLIYHLALVQGFNYAAANLCAVSWIYNPLAIVISTRGNADSVSQVLVLATLFIIQKRKNIILAGMLHALAIHVRLYPIAFSLPMYLALRTTESSHKNNKERQLHPKKLLDWNTVKIFVLSLYPNRSQLYLVLSCMTTIILLTAVCYQLYGFQFLNESMLYHLSRRDIRHNFSVYFYMLYLSSVNVVNIWQKILVFIPQIVLIVSLSLVYGSRRDLPFCLLTQTIIMVTYNPVVTSQYFIWFLSLLSPCLPHITLSKPQAGALASLWFAAQISWLLPAYLLEFRGRETFLYIWLQGMAFFCVNIAILVRLIESYHPNTQKIK